MVRLLAALDANVDPVQQQLVLQVLETNPWVPIHSASVWCYTVFVDCLIWNRRWVAI